MTTGVYVKGITLQVMYQQLLNIRSKPDNRFEAGWLLLEHEQGQAHCDPEVDNVIRQCVNCQVTAGNTSHITLQGDIQGMTKCAFCLPMGLLSRGVHIFRV